MKKANLLVLFIFVITLIARSQEPIIRVDQRVEFLSIVARLAEFEEYSNSMVPEYSEKIESYFKNFKNHDLINYLKENRKKNEIAYDAIMSLSLRLDLNGNVTIAYDIENLDKRWNMQELEILETYLNDFYKKTRFIDFYNSNEKIYKSAKASLAESVSNIDYEWFNDFYGQEGSAKYVLVAGLHIVGNYGPSVKGVECDTIYSILSPSRISKEGLPIYEKYLIEDVAIHEFTHSYMNSLVLENFEELEMQAGKFYEIAQKDFEKMAYGSPLAVYLESFVRAGVIEYYKQHGETELQIRIKKDNECRQNFYLVPSLVEYFVDYNKNRKDFALLGDYFPTIISEQNKLSAIQLKEDFINKPVEKCWVVSSSIENNATDIDPKLDSLVLTFNTPLSLWHNGITNVGKKASGFDYKRNRRWNYETGKEFIVPLALEPDMDYSIKFFGFKSASHGKMKKAYILNFSTAKD